MGLLFYVPAVFGILRHRHWPYWRWVIAMLVWVNVMWLLFADGGLITEPLEQAGHSIVIGILALPMLLLIWGGIFFIVRRLYVEAKATGLGPALVKPVSGLRKGAELTALTLACGLALYLNVIAIFPSKDAEAGAQSSASVEARIDRVVATMAPNLPMKLDDITTIVGASRDGRLMVIDHEISSPEVSREVVEPYLREQKPAEACAISDIRKSLADGISYRYRYKLAAGGAPIEMTLTATDCTAIEARSLAPTSPPAGTK